jgi:predicted metal-dependent hydrolase
MSHPLVVRKLHINLRDQLERHWNGDPFMTAFFNALSMSFPVGEQYFIDSVKNGVAAMPPNEEDAQTREIAQKFIGQEATHRFLHGQFNQHLEERGLKNHWEKRILKRMAFLENQLKRSRAPYLHNLAITSAYEHFTAILGIKLLAHIDQQSDWLRDATPEMKTLWRWHASEEVEHRSVAFELYQRLGGNYRYRVRWFAVVLIYTYFDVIHQTFSNLWHDKSLFKLSTWWSACKFFWGRNGFFYDVTRESLKYFRQDFHPANYTEEQLAQTWLTTHKSMWTAI